MKIACLCLVVQLYWLLGPVFGFPINMEMQPAKIKQYGIFAEESVYFHRVSGGSHSVFLLKHF